jgi:hypothetical protein
MFARSRWAVGGAGIFVLIAGLSCFSPLEFLNPEFISSLGVQGRVASLPGQAPGLVVSVENRTTRAAEITVSYRDADDAVQTYTTYLEAGNSSGQMLVCPISEITIGSITDLRSSGARVALVEGLVGGDLNSVPTIDVEAFGTLLRQGVNYECGDAINFVLRASGTTSSGFEEIAFFEHASTD